MFHIFGVEKKNEGRHGEGKYHFWGKVKSRSNGETVQCVKVQLKKKKGGLEGKEKSVGKGGKAGRATGQSREVQKKEISTIAGGRLR